MDFPCEGLDWITSGYAGMNYRLSSCPSLCENVFFIRLTVLGFQLWLDASWIGLKGDW